MRNGPVHCPELLACHSTTTGTPSYSLFIWSTWVYLRFSADVNILTSDLAGTAEGFHCFSVLACHELFSRGIRATPSTMFPVRLDPPFAVCFSPSWSELTICLFILVTENKWLHPCKVPTKRQVTSHMKALFKGLIVLFFLLFFWLKIQIKVSAKGFLLRKKSYILVDFINNYQRKF